VGSKRGILVGGEEFVGVFPKLFGQIEIVLVICLPETISRISMLILAPSQKTMCIRCTGRRHRRAKEVPGVPRVI